MSIARAAELGILRGLVRPVREASAVRKPPSGWPRTTRSPTFSRGRRRRPRWAHHMTLREQLQAHLGSAYTVERELGGGGMSRVFVALETRLGRRVVVKVLSTEVMAGISAERFEREIRVAASLQQANIVPVLSAGDMNGAPYYTMPFVAGESLRVRLREKGRLAIGETVSILRDVARALGYAHEVGIVHRDIKPDNVLLSGGTAVVTDFGIAKALRAARTDPEHTTLTQLGTALGTPAYVSPEQAAGDPSVDHRADIYSFGCLAYEMLAGSPPFANRAAQRIVAAHMAEAPRPVQELRPDTPSTLAVLVMGCLEKDASARPQSASDILATLDAITTSDPSRPAMPAVLLGGPRMLWKALGTYAVAFVAVAIVARAAIVGIGLPTWVFPGALIVMALGMPVILLTAYTQHVLRRAITQSASFTPGGTRSLPAHGTMASLAIKASPHVSWRRAMLGGVWAVGTFVVLVAAFMLLRALGIGPAGSLLAASKITPQAPVLITDFSTTNTDTALGAVLSDAVRAGLAQSKVISLVTPARVASTLSLMGRPSGTRLDVTLARELAEREGVHAIVDGSVTGVPGGYILALRLVTADSGVELASFRETADGPRGLIDAADKIVRDARAKIGESLRAVQASPRLARETTSSLEALRLFSEGDRLIIASGDPSRAVTFYRQALALDSNFALAWSHLASTLTNLTTSQAAIDTALDNAYRLRDRLTDQERLVVLGSYYAVGSHRDRGRALDAYEQASRMQEDGRDVSLNDMGEILRTMRLYAQAESIDVQGWHLDSGSAIAAANIAELELDQGGVDSAAATLAAAARAHPESPFVLTDASLVPYARGDLARAQRAIDSLAGASENFSRIFGLRFGADLALVHGQLLLAERYLNLSGGDDRTALLDSLRLITAAAWFRNTDASAMDRMAASLARYPLGAMILEDRPYFAVATAWARIGRPDRADAVIAAYRAAVTDTTVLRVRGADLHTALGEIALAERHPDRAVVEFRLGDIASDNRPANECAPCLPLELARAYDAAGQADSAIAEYERFISTPYWNRLDETDPLGLALAHERLGELYEARRDWSHAAAHDERFIALWSNADASLQPRVAEVMRRMARLGKREGSAP